MRKAILCCIALLFSFCSFSQRTKHSFGIYSSVYNGGGMLALSMGGAGVGIENTFVLGAEYQHYINKWLSLNAGMEYSKRSVNVSYDFIAPDKHGHIKYLTIPFYLRADICKWLFFTFGAIIDVDEQNDVTTRHSNIGITGGTGFKYDFKNKTTIFLHPFYQLHNVNNSELLLGMRVGVSYRF